MVKVQKFIPKSIERIKKEANGKTIIALSGGVDSLVCAVLANLGFFVNFAPYPHQHKLFNPKNPNTNHAPKKRKNQG